MLLVDVVKRHDRARRVNWVQEAVVRLGVRERPPRSWQCRANPCWLAGSISLERSVMLVTLFIFLALIKSVDLLVLYRDLLR